MKIVFNPILSLSLIALCALASCFPDFNSESRAIFASGIAYYHEGKYDEAMNDFRSTILREYKPAESYYYVGNISVEKNQLEEAIAAYQKAIEFKRNYSEAYYGLARAYSLKGVAPKAIAVLGKAIDLKRHWRDIARDDPAFSNLRDTPEFQRDVP